MPTMLQERYITEESELLYSKLLMRLNKTRQKNQDLLYEIMILKQQLKTCKGFYNKLLRFLAVFSLVSFCSYSVVAYIQSILSNTCIK
jgi:hypothetical protein